MSMNKSEFKVWLLDYIYDMDEEVAEEISAEYEEYNLGGLLFDAIQELNKQKIKLKEEPQ